MDQAEWPEVLGTVAGDDTVLVVTQDNVAAEAVRLRLVKYLEG
ncbi:MAG: hypothetical protein NTY38_11940 [Acidobacteria bacterium]|nr:hypothetical protein [Acidobacteriota bacterium]